MTASAPARTEAVRALEGMPADKLPSGLRLRVLAGAAEPQPTDSDAWRRAAGERLAVERAPLPFQTVANELREMEVGSELLGEALVLGDVREVLQPDSAAGVGSAGTREVEGRLSGDAPKRYRSAVEGRSGIGNHDHFMHVAGIARAGNSSARQVVGRIDEIASTPLKFRPVPCTRRPEGSVQGFRFSGTEKKCTSGTTDHFSLPRP